MTTIPVSPEPAREVAQTEAGMMVNSEVKGRIGVKRTVNKKKKARLGAWAFYALAGN
jgi:hypothetical protein